MTVLITLTIAGSSTGPFNLYSNIGNYATPFETNVPKASLVAGYLSTSVPAGTTIVQVRSLGTCTNSIDIPIDLLTTSTTSTSTTSTTTTTVPTTTTTTVDPFYYYIANQYTCPNCENVIGTNMVIKSVTPLTIGNWVPWSSGGNTFMFNVLSVSAPFYMATLVDGIGASPTCGCSTSSTTTTTTTSSTTTVPTTSTTTTTIPILECVELTNDIVTTQQTCLGLPYDLKLGTITLDLVDSLGAPSIATNDVTVTLSFQSRQCGDSAPIPTTVDAVILTGTSSITHSYTREQTTDCGQGECQLEYEIFQSVVSVEPSAKYAMCNVGSSTTTTSTTSTTTAPVFTITTTSCPNTYHTILNRIYFGISGSFGPINLGPFETACWAAEALNSPNSNVYATAFSEAYWYNGSPSIGDGPFSAPDNSCTISYEDGYFLMQIGGVYTVVQFMNNVIVAFPTCSSNPAFIPSNWQLYSVTQGYTTEALACAAYAFDGGQTGGVGTPTTILGPTSGIVNGTQVFNTDGSTFVANTALFYIITPYINLVPGLEGTCQFNIYGQVQNSQFMNCMTINIP